MSRPTGPRWLRARGAGPTPGPHFALVFTLALPLVASGCLSSSTLVKLQVDGSGTVVQTTMITAEGLAQIRALRDMAANRDATPGAAPELFSAEQARAKAATMGEGVRFVSSRKLKTDDSEGIEAIYAFDDVSGLRLSDRPEPPVAAGGAFAPREGSPPAVFRLARRRDGSARLSISLPRGDPPPEDPAPSPSPSDEARPKQISQMKLLFKGLAVRLAVEVPRLVGTNSPYVSGSTVTLLEMDFGALLSNEAKLEELAARRIRSFDEAKRVLRGVPGFKISPDPEVVLELIGR